MESEGARAVRERVVWRAGGTDMWPLLGDPRITDRVVGGLASLHAKDFDVVLGPDPGGLLFGPLVARHLGLPFAPVCRDRDFFFQGPHAAVEVTTARGQLLVHRAALAAGTRVLLVDDWSESGSTVTGVQSIVDKVGARLEAVSFIVDSLGDAARESLAAVPIAALALPGQLNHGS